MAQEPEDEDFASFLDLFTGIFFLMLLLVLMLFLLMGDGKSKADKEALKEKESIIEKLEESLGVAKSQAGKLPGMEQEVTKLITKNQELTDLTKQWKLAEGGWFAEKKKKDEENDSLRLSLIKAQELAGKVPGLEQEITKLVTKNQELTDLAKQWKLAEGGWFAERKKMEEERGTLRISLIKAQELAGKVPGLEQEVVKLITKNQELTDLTKQWKLAEGGWFVERKKMEEERGTLRVSLIKAQELAGKVPGLEQEVVKLVAGNTELINVNNQWKSAAAGWVAELKKKDEEINSLKSGMGMMTLGMALTRDFGNSIELDASGFSSGSASLPSGLAHEIKERVPGMEQKAKGRYNTIEIIGHTDGDPVTYKSVTSDDNDLAVAIAGQYDGAVEGLTFKSNMELGMARALTVYRAITNFRDSLPSIKFMRVYSAGQYTKGGNIDLTDYSGSVIDTSTRRKIEVRLTYTPE